MIPPMKLPNSLIVEPAMVNIYRTTEKMVPMMLLKTSKIEPSKSEKALAIEDILGFVTSHEAEQGKTGCVPSGVGCLLVDALAPTDR